MLEVETYFISADLHDWNVLFEFILIFYFYYLLKIFGCRKEITDLLCLLLEL